MERLSASIFELTRKKKINSRLGSRVMTKNENLFLKPGGGFSLIERFPVYEKKKTKKEGEQKQ